MSDPVEKLPDTYVAHEVLQDEHLSEVTNRVIYDLNAVWSAFQRQHEFAKRNSSFVQGKQWEEWQIADHINQFRIPYVFNQIENKVNSLLGQEEQLRLDCTAVPVEPGDIKAAELSGRLIQWFNQINNIETIQSEVFYDDIVKGLGAVVVRWEDKDLLFGYPAIERVPIYQLVWDTNSVMSDCSDAQWMARVMPMTKQEALEVFPEHADDINAAPVITYGTGYSVYNVLTERQRLNPAFGSGLDDARHLIRVVEHCEKLRQKVFIAIDEISDVIQEFDDESLATEWINGTRSGYESKGLITINDDGSEKVYVVTMTKDTYALNIMIGERVVRRTITGLPSFPWVIVFCYFDDGSYWSAVDSLIDPQIFTNRLVSEWDNQFGRASKQVWTVIEHRLKKGWTLEDIRRERSKTAATIPVASHDAINQLPNQPLQQEIPIALQFAIGHMTDVVGGRNILGLQENAAESGEAVRQRQEAAGASRLSIFTRLNSWRKRVTELALWYAKNFLPDTQILRIIGDSGETEFVSLDTDVLDNLKTARVDVVVTESIQSATLRERQFRQVKELAQAGVLPPDIALDAMLEYSELPSKSKEKMRSRIQSMQKFQADQLEMYRKQKMEQQVKDSVEKKAMREKIAAELQLPA